MTEARRNSRKQDARTSRMDATYLTFHGLGKKATSQELFDAFTQGNAILPVYRDAVRQSGDMPSDYTYADWLDKRIAKAIGTGVMSNRAHSRNQVLLDANRLRELDRTGMSSKDNTVQLDGIVNHRGRLVGGIVYLYAPTQDELTQQQEAFQQVRRGLGGLVETNSWLVVVTPRRRNPSVQGVELVSLPMSVRHIERYRKLMVNHYRPTSEDPTIAEVRHPYRKKVRKDLAEVVAQLCLA